jgi:hypothetical protein
MRTAWKLLTIAAMILTGCGKEDKKPSSPAGGTPAAPSAPATYTIKLKRFPDVGKSVVITGTEKITGTVKVTDSTGKVLNEGKEKADEVSEKKYTQTILEGDGARPRKYKEEYEKAIAHSAPRPLQGRTVVYELKGDKYEVTVEGEPALDAKDLKELTDKANKPDLNAAVTPKNPVKTGETWPIDVQVLAKALGEGQDLDAAQSKADAKLVRVYDKDGKRFGVIELHLKAAFKSMQGMAFDPPLVIEMQGTLDTAIDGSGTAGKMTMNGKINGKGQAGKAPMTVTVEMANNMVAEQERSAEK